MALSNDTFKDIENLIDDTIVVDCQILPESDLPKGYPRLLCTDQVLVLPTETYIRILVTSNDVIHSWSLPSFGIKMDGIPGRINQVLLVTPFFGTVWGQCSELCGINHGFMPIELRMVGLAEFKEYINLMLLTSIEEINKTFLKTHSYSGFMLNLDQNNILSYWANYTSTTMEHNSISTMMEYNSMSTTMEHNSISTTMEHSSMEEVITPESDYDLFMKWVIEDAAKGEEFTGVCEQPSFSIAQYRC